MSLKQRFAQQDEVGRFPAYEVTGPNSGKHGSVMLPGIWYKSLQRGG